MLAGKNASNLYVSPAKRAALRLSEGGEQKEPYLRVRVARRIRKLSPIVVLDLEAAEAPMHVFRWVSDGPSLTEHRRRTDLALHLRRTIERRRNGWISDAQLSAALAVWDEAIAEARARGLISPRPDAIAPERFGAAIAAARKAPRVRADHTVGDAPPEASGEATPDNVDQDAADIVGEKAADKTDDGVSPARARTLRELAAVLDRALAEGDLEAARVTNEMIGRLVPARRAE